MTRLRGVALVAAWLLLAGWATAQEPPALVTAHGTVDKVDKETLAIRPRGPDGKFGKAVSLKLTGTSKVFTLAPQMRAGKLVLTQKETEAKELTANQTIAVIYATAKDGPVLLSAVVLPAKEK
jgi:hypothetical protein